MKPNEQSRYLAGSHIKKFADYVEFMSILNDKGKLKIEEVIEPINFDEPIVELVDSADLELNRIVNSLSVTPSNFEVLAHVSPTPKEQSIISEVCALAPAFVKIPLLSDSAVQSLCKWAANYLWQQGKQVSITTVQNLLKSGGEMVKNKIKSFGSKNGGKNVGSVSSTPKTAPTRMSAGGGAIEVAAPVSVGNVLSGKRTVASSVKKGHLVIGREFLASAYGSGSIATWTMVSGMPLTPVAFVDSMLRMYGSMYTYFRWKKLVVHYVTTSPTSSNGSVMFYYNKDRASVFLEQTSPNLLPFVLSDPHTTISPQWQNFSVNLEVTGDLKRCDYGMTDDSTHYCAGELFLLSRTSTTDSPGHLLMDYEIEFSEQNLTPRLTLWPQPTIAYVPYAWVFPTSVAGNSVVLLLDGVAGHNQFVSANTNQLISGGIYKVIFDFTNGHLGTTTPASTLSNLFTYGATTSKINVNAEDGMTVYAVNGSAGIQLYENLAAAYTNTASIFWQTTFTVAPTTDWFLTWFSLVGFQGNNAITSFM